MFQKQLKQSDSQIHQTTRIAKANQPDKFKRMGRAPLNTMNQLKQQSGQHKPTGGPLSKTVFSISMMKAMLALMMNHFAIVKKIR